MGVISRKLENQIHQEIARGKSVLLLGPRQTGKTTLLKDLEADLSYSFLLPKTRQRLEQDPDALIREVEALPKGRKIPVIFLDEIQKVPSLLDPIQYLIDQKKAKFLLSGSSARKLKRTQSANLLPGRLTTFRLDPFSISEWTNQSLENLLLYGSLPFVALENDPQIKEQELTSYVESYLEEEIRSEAIVRNLGPFSRFLELAALDSGKITNYRNLSREIGVSHTTIADYYQVLEDTLIVDRIDPFTESNSRKKLTKSPRYLFFDLGISRVAAREFPFYSETRKGEIFENLIGLELIRLTRNSVPRMRVSFWRDPDGPEVDYVLEKGNELIPIEVKLTSRPTNSHIKHLQTFLKEYPKASKAYLICNVEIPQKFSDSIIAMPYNRIHEI